jgi:hypothetical protein
MKSKESNLTDFNFYFITFPRQTFVNIIDSGKGGDEQPNLPDEKEM